jgi:hypothetical protein
MAHAHDHAHEAHAHAPAHEGDDLPHHGPVLAEPRSPAWLPFVGAALAGLALVWWLSTPSAAEEAAAAAASASASAESPPAAEAAPAAPQPAQPQGGAPGRPQKPQLPPGILKGQVAPTVDLNKNYKELKK